MHQLNLSEKLEMLLIGAERYACGRRTYIVSETVNYLISILPKLSDHTLRVFKQDMDSTKQMAERSSDKIWGDECDLRDWMRFADSVEREIDRREADGRC